MGVSDKQGVFSGDDNGQRGNFIETVILLGDAQNTAEMAMKTTDRAANHGVGLTHLDHHGRLRSFAVTQYFARFRQGLAAPFGTLVKILYPVLVVAVFHDFEVTSGFDDQPVFLDSRPDNLFATDSDRRTQLFLDDAVDSLQHFGAFAFRKHHSMPGGERQIEYRFHEQSRAEHEGAQFLAVGFHVCDRTFGYPGIHRCLCHRRCDFKNQTLIKRLGDQIFRAKR